MVEKTPATLADYCRLYTRAAIAFKDDAVNQDGYVSDDVARAALEAMSQCLRGYVRSSNLTSDGSPVEHLPVEIVAEIANWVGIVLSGKVPTILQHVARVGSPALLPRESKSIGLAVAYIKMCESGAIENRAPVKTVAEAFGVVPRTVSRWKKDFSWVCPEDFFRELSSNARAAKIAGNLPCEADRYQRFGRGEKGRVQHPRPGKRRVATARADTTK